MFLYEGMLDVLTMERGGHVPGTRVQRVTARTATAAVAPKYSPQCVKRLRARTKLSQTVFASALNVSPATVRAWEIGQKAPHGTVLRLLQLTDQHPEWILATVQARFGISGRSTTPGKRVYVKAYRGFESLSVRGKSL